MSSICPYCSAEIGKSEASHKCASCSSKHHAECWTENGGCATPACQEAPAITAVQPAPGVPPTAADPQITGGAQPAPAVIPALPAAGGDLGSQPPAMPVGNVGSAGIPAGATPMGGITNPNNRTMVVVAVGALILGGLTGVAIGGGGGAGGTATSTETDSGGYIETYTETEADSGGYIETYTETEAYTETETTSYP